MSEINNDVLEFLKERVDEEALKILVDKIAENKNLRQSDEALYEENCRLSMEVFDLELIEQQRNDDLAQLNSSTERLNEVYTDSQRLLGLVQHFNFNILANNENQQAYRNFVEQMQEIETEYKHKQYMYEKMENRHIVQQLRKEQQQLQVAKEMAENIKSALPLKELALKKQISLKIKERNKRIVNLVTNAVESEKRKERIRQEKLRLIKIKAELESKLKQQQDTQAVQKSVPLALPTPLPIVSNFPTNEMASSTKEAQEFLKNYKPCSATSINFYELYMKRCGAKAVPVQNATNRALKISSSEEVESHDADQNLPRIESKLKHQQDTQAVQKPLPLPIPLPIVSNLPTNEVSSSTKEAQEFLKNYKPCSATSINFYELYMKRCSAKAVPVKTSTSSALKISSSVEVEKDNTKQILEATNTPTGDLKLSTNLTLSTVAVAEQVPAILKPNPKEIPSLSTTTFKSDGLDFVKSFGHYVQSSVNSNDQMKKHKTSEDLSNKTLYTATGIEAELTCSKQSAPSPLNGTMSLKKDALSMDKQHVNVKVSAKDFHKSLEPPRTIKFPSLMEYMADLQLNKTEQCLTAAEPVSILSNCSKIPIKKAAENFKNDQPAKRVCFMVPESSQNSETTSTETTEFNSTESHPSTLNKNSSLHKVGDISDMETDTINLITPKAKQNSDDITYEKISDVDTDDSNVSTGDMNTDNNQTQKPKIEIQDCRIVKPAGTALPQQLPTNLSPNTEKALKDQNDERNFQMPITAETNKPTKTLEFNELSPAKQTNKLDKNDTIDFEEMLLEVGSDNSTNGNNNKDMLAFGDVSTTMSDDAFSFDFDDNAGEMGAVRNSNFL